MASSRILRPSDYRVTPWKNGGGRTAEIHAHPPGAALDAFLWRASLAEVAADGPFSSFPGVDRSLVLLEGNGIHLRGDPIDVVLRAPFDRCEFSGDAAIHGALLGGPVRDFNLMVRHSHAHGRVTVVRGSRMSLPAARFLLCHAAVGTHRCTAGEGASIEVGQGDSLLVDAGDGVTGFDVQPASATAVALVATVDLR